MRSSFSQWVLSMARIRTQDLSTLSQTLESELSHYPHDGIRWLFRLCQVRYMINQWQTNLELSVIGPKTTLLQNAGIKARLPRGLVEFSELLITF